MHLQEKTIGSETTYLGKVFYVTKDTARLEDGKAVQRDVVHHLSLIHISEPTRRS